MELDAYRRRIGFKGTVVPTLECLTQIHRQQAFTVPHEALDIMFGRTVDRDVDDTPSRFSPVVSNE